MLSCLNKEKHFTEVSESTRLSESAGTGRSLGVTRRRDGEKMDVIITLIGAEGGGHEQSMRRISCAAPWSAVSPPALLRSHCCIRQPAKKMCKSRGLAALALAQG